MSSPSPRLDRVLHGPGRFHALVHLPTTTSTNDELVQRPELPMGVAVVADEQTAGRGRAGRRWENAPTGPDGSLLVSVVVEPPLDLPLTPLAAGLAVADAIIRQVGDEPGARVQLKWPNDVLVGGRKVAGLLAEHHGPQRLPDRSVMPARVIIGIGVDVDWRGAERTGESAAWTSLAEVHGEHVSRWELLADLLVALDTWLGQLEGQGAQTLQLYAARCATIGQRVRVTSIDGGVVEGMATGLDPSGALQVTTDDGLISTVRAADVEHAALG